MRTHAFKARPRRRRLPTDAGERSIIAGNVLDRQFGADGPNRRWVADFTYIWTAEGWLYVAVVLDLFSRRIVGWSMSASMTAQLVIDALTMALWRRGRSDALLHHSDQGSQYTSEAFQRLLADHGVDCSMSRSGNCWDNAAMESFFSSLKTERVSRRTYRTRDDAKADVFDYIERFYNPKRRHSTIGYLSPIAFEEKMALA
jgi:putative transposase